MICPSTTHHKGCECWEAERTLVHGAGFLRKAGEAVCDLARDAYYETARLVRLVPKKAKKTKRPAEGSGVIEIQDLDISVRQRGICESCGTLCDATDICATCLDNQSRARGGR